MHKVPIADHYFVNRKDTPEINQEYLESLGERYRTRGEELIKKGQEWRETHQSLRTQPMSPYAGDRDDSNSCSGNGSGLGVGGSSLNNLIQAGISQERFSSTNGSAEEQEESKASQFFNIETIGTPSSAQELKEQFDRYKQRL